MPPPAPATKLNSRLPVALENILAKSLEKDPNLRYQTAGELRADLKRLKRDLDLSGSGHGSRRHAGTESLPRCQAHQPGWLGRPWCQPSVLAVSVAIILGYFLTRPVAPPRITRTTQLTNTNRPKSDVVTDGSRLYFIEGLSTLSQTSVTGGETFPIPTSLEDTGFANVFDISPDGSSLLMNTALGTSLDGPLWSVPVLGGSPRRLGNLEGHAGAWSPDGRKIAFSKGNEIFVAKSDGSDPRKLLATAGTSGDLRWSPDGSILRFTLERSQTNNRSIWQASADGRDLHPLSPVGAPRPTNAAADGRPTDSILSFRPCATDS